MAIIAEYWLFDNSFFYQIIQFALKEPFLQYYIST